MKILGLQIPFTQVQNKVQPLPKQADVRKIITIPDPSYRIRTDLLRYRNAVNYAEQPTNPQRFDLYMVYNQVVVDAHVTAAITQRKNLTLQKEWYVYNQDETENDEKTKLIRTKWFLDFISLCLDSLFYGHSLIQFESIIKLNGVEQFKCVELVPRINVKPEFHIVTNSYAALEGTDYLELPYSNWCIGVGDRLDLGLLMKIAPLQIWKKNALGAWAEYSEKFGTPIRILYSDSYDKDTQAKENEMVTKMGTSFAAIIGTDQKFDIKEFNGSDAYQVFDMMIQRCNSEISKLILGQTSTLDEKAFVGSAEVHERVLQSYAYSDEIFVTNIINNQLIPFMNNLGFGLEGCYIGVESEDEFTLQEQSAFDIELLKTGKFTFTPDYIKENYGSEVIEVKEPVDNSIPNIKNLYS